MGVRAIASRAASALGELDFEEDGVIAPLAFPDIQLSVERPLV